VTRVPLREEGYAAPPLKDTDDDEDEEDVDDDED
jgi:hypothetical protein